MPYMLTSFIFFKKDGAWPNKHICQLVTDKQSNSNPDHSEKRDACNKVSLQKSSIIHDDASTSLFSFSAVDGGFGWYFCRDRKGKGMGRQNSGQVQAQDEQVKNRANPMCAMSQDRPLGPRMSRKTQLEERFEKRTGQEQRCFTGVSGKTLKPPSFSGASWICLTIMPGENLRESLDDTTWNDGASCLNGVD